VAEDRWRMAFAGRKELGEKVLKYEHLRCVNEIQKQNIPHDM
jgi:hypothetical protein